MFKKCENNLKRIATIGNDGTTQLHTQERVVRLNVMRSLANELRVLSTMFRNSQREFLFRKCVASCQHHGCSCSHPHTQKHTYTYTHTHTHIHTHTYTHTHTHTYALVNLGRKGQEQVANEFGFTDEKDDFSVNDIFDRVLLN